MNFWYVCFEFNFLAEEVKYTLYNIRWYAMHTPPFFITVWIKNHGKSIRNFYCEAPYGFDKICFSNFKYYTNGFTCQHENFLKCLYYIRERHQNAFFDVMMAKVMTAAAAAMSGR